MGGIWEERYNSDMFGELTIVPPIIKQKIACDDYCGESMTSASTPWNGDEGANPLAYINEEIGLFHCNCTNDPNCEDIEFHDCEYVYNMYLCEFYEIETPDNFDYQGAWVENPHEVDNNLVITFTFSAFGGYTGTPKEIVWDWELPAGL